MTERTTILIVDDESKIRRLLSRSLEAEGFDVIENNQIAMTVL